MDLAGGLSPMGATSVGLRRGGETCWAAARAVVVRVHMVTEKREVLGR